LNARAALYSAIDDEVTQYDIDIEAATLTRRSSIRVASFVQEGWAHPSRRTLYLTTSNRGPGLKADTNNVSAKRAGSKAGPTTEAQRRQ